LRLEQYEAWMKRIAIVVVVGALSGCSYTMQLMPRDSGTIYSGQVKSNGAGGGTLSVALDGRTCSGSFVQAASGDSFGFIQSFGARSTNMSTIQSFGSSQYKALLSCSDNSGLRCDVVGTSSSGAGVCMDSRSRVYDLMYSL
jgi:hypothetical protein